MLEPFRGLSALDLDAIADLERRVVAADGGRLKLEWGSLRGRTAERTDDFVWIEDGRVLGFVGIYSFGPDAELAGMVDPQARRHCVGARLLDAATAECRSRGLAHALLIVPRPSAGGAALARRRAGRVDHSEHALVLDGEPVDGPSDPAVLVRRAMPADTSAVATLLAGAFGFAPPGIADKLSGDGSWTELIEREGVPIGTLRLTLDGDNGFVHGFAVDPAVQGRGVGRDALRRSCRQLRDRGARRVALEVAVENERALGLYTSIGFQPVLTEDYWRLPCS